MEIRNLSGVKLEHLMECFNRAFDGYFVKMPTELSFWKARFEAARVDYSLSYGIWAENQLIGFILNGVDADQGEKTAFNTGTGVLHGFRGNRLVDEMYAHAIDKLKESGIAKCKLEVIDRNERAIRVYERIGFVKTRKLKCYTGELDFDLKLGVNLRHVDIDESIHLSETEAQYSWDNTWLTILKSKGLYQMYTVVEGDKNTKLGYFIMNPKTGYIAQLESKDRRWKEIFEGISLVSKTFKINNIDEKRIELIEYLERQDHQNKVDQFEMEMKI